MDKIVQLQLAFGNWVLNNELVTTVGATNANSVDEARRVVTTAIERVIGTGHQISDDSVATVMALATLQSQYASKQAQWRLLASKSKAYLATQAGFSSSTIVNNVIAEAVLELSF